MDINLEKLIQISQTAYNISASLKDYCRGNINNIKEIENLCPLVEYLHKNVDTINYMLLQIDHKSSKINLLE